MKVTISNGSVLADSTCEALKVDTTEATATKNYFELSGGTYSSEPVAEYVAAGYTVDKNADGTYTINKIEATDVEEKVVVDAPKVEVDASLTEEDVYKRQA